MPRDVCRQRHEKWHVQVSVISRETFAKHHRWNVSRISRWRFQSKLRLTLEDTQIPAEKKITKRNEYDTLWRISRSTKKKNQIKNYRNSSRIMTQHTRNENFSRKSTRQRHQFEMQKGNRYIYHTNIYIYISKLPRKRGFACVHRGRIRRWNFRWMSRDRCRAQKPRRQREPQTVVVTSNRGVIRPQVSSRVQISIRRCSLILFSLRHATVQRTRPGRVSLCPLYTYSVVRFRFCFMQFSISDIRRVSPPGGIN